jgi:hypothetical protein
VLPEQPGLESFQGLHFTANIGEYDMKSIFPFAMLFGILVSQSSASADEASAWAALRDATEEIETATFNLATHDSEDGGLPAVGQLLGLSLQYLDGLVHGGKSRDDDIESHLEEGFGYIEDAFQADGLAAKRIENAFNALGGAAAALGVREFQIAQDAAEAAVGEAELAQDSVEDYGADLDLLRAVNADLADVIEAWLSESRDGKEK